MMVDMCEMNMSSSSMRCNIALHSRNIQHGDCVTM